MDLSEAMIRYYLDSVTVGYFNHNDVPPDDVSGYRDQVMAMQRKALSHGDLDALRLAFEYLLAHPEFETTDLGGERYPYSDQEIREIIHYVWNTLWPDAPDIIQGEGPDVRIVSVPLEDWWRSRAGRPEA